MQLAAWIESFFGLGQLLVEFLGFLRVLFGHDDLQHHDLIPGCLPGNPLPFSRSFRPLEEPLGTFTFTFEPTVGTVTEAPIAASQGAMGTVTSISRPSTVK